MATRENSNLEVMKTYKLFIGGSFPRTESGRYYPIRKKNGDLLANVCLSSRKDFRNAVVAARKAQSAWAGRSAYNRSQIIYRIAEMLQQSEDSLVQEMVSLGYTPKNAKEEFDYSVDYLVHYSGWCDKFSQMHSTVNPVASSHFNFSNPEPMGVIGAFAAERRALIGVLEAFVPAICGGNTVVLLASHKLPTCSITLAEILAISDVPGGVVNILTGEREELLSHFTSHMDVNAFQIWDASKEESFVIDQNSTENLKRVRLYKSSIRTRLSPYRILDLQEVKTTWHPIENISGSGASY
ncbi:MAG: aldehyde dehydrogenase family protein [Flavobacteriales bacterium]|nr:aldehyde dehydrogenase family protein [Flavobacteriales bacterium]